MTKKWWIPTLALIALFLTLPALAEEPAAAEPAPLPDACEEVEGLADIGLPPVTFLACSAVSQCEDGSWISCSCPGSGTCHDNGNWVECLCNGAPDDEDICPVSNPCPPPGSKCLWGKSCGGECAHSVCGGGSCVQGRCNCDA